MESMTILEEWKRSIVALSTKKHHLRSLRYFVEYMEETPEALLKLRRKQYGKSKYLETRAIEFFKWLQEEKKLSNNSAKSTIIGVRSFFSYFDVPLKLKGKIGSTHMRLDEAPFTIEDVRAMYKYNGLREKLWISLSIDAPLRIGDLLSLKREQIGSEFMIKSEKESVVGKVFISQRTLDLLKKFWNTVPESKYVFTTTQGKPYDQDSINKMLKRSCRRAGLNEKLCKKIHQQLFRKLFISAAVNLGLQTEIIKILTFKSVGQDMLTYMLNRHDLREHWKKVTNVLDLEPTKANGRINSIQEIAHVAAEALMEFLEPVIEKKLLARQASRGGEGLGLMTKPDLSGMSTKEKLELYIKLVREEKEKWS